MAFWISDEQETKLKELWAAGHSASRIAKMMGAATRNVIIGKANRLGLPARAPCRVATRKKSVRTAHLKHTPRDPDRLPRGVNKLERDVLGLAPRRSHAWATDFDTSRREAPPPPNEYDVARITTADLEPHHCKWPVGDPGTPGFGHCGCKREEGLPYCAEHVRRATSSPGTPREANTGWKPRTSGVMLRRMTSSVNLFEDA